MTLWYHLEQFLSAVSQESAATLERLFERARDYVSDLHRRSIPFTIAIVALSAKMAKADGVVTADEVSVFKRLFVFEEDQSTQVVRLFNLAKEDTAGYEVYAMRIAEIYEDNPERLTDVLDALFHIAGADGVIHDDELIFLDRVANIFSVSEGCYERIKSQHIANHPHDPYRILGIDRTISGPELRKHYLKTVAEIHPDKLIARGLPPEYIKIANDRLALINDAYERISRVCEIA